MMLTAERWSSPVRSAATKLDYVHVPINCISAVHARNVEYSNSVFCCVYLSPPT